MPQVSDVRLSDAGELAVGDRDCSIPAAPTAWGVAYSLNAESEDDGELWLGLDCGAAAVLVSCLVGGPVGSGSQRSSLTAIEERLIAGLVEAVMGEIAAIYLNAAIAPEGGRRMQQWVAPADRELEVLQCVLSDGLVQGQLWLAALQSGTKPRGFWSGSGSAAVQITAGLAAEGLGDDEVNALSPGDLIVTDVPADSDLTVRIAGIPKYSGHLTLHGDRRAITLTDKSDM